MNAHSSFLAAEPLPLPLPIVGEALPAGAPIDDPRREIRAGIATIALFATVFIGWSALAPLGAAANAPGVVRVSGERKAVQSLAGGIVAGLSVVEGAHVRAGDIVVRFSNDEALGTERSLTHRVVGLEAQIARLDAQRIGAARVVAPAAFVDLPTDDRDDAQHALAVEQQALDTIRAAAFAQKAALHQRIAQIGAQISGYNVKQHSLEAQSTLNDQELQSVERLAALGYSTQTRVLALKRSAAGLSGDAGSAGAEAAGLKSAVSEAQMQIVQVDANLAQDTTKQLRDAQAELDAVIPQWEAARAKLAQTELRAPVSGQVVGLTMHTVGGVASPGQTLMEIVPDDRSLVVEAQVNVADANEIAVGQSARLRVTSLHGRQIPVLAGRVVRVSADALTDQKTGKAFYTASVQVPASELAKLSQAAAIREVRPGTPVDVQVSLHKRTMLTYWIDPIRELFSKIGGER